MKLSKIQELNKKDYAKIIELWEASVCATHDFLSESDFLFYKEQIEGYLELLSSYGIMVNDKLKGFISVSDNMIEMLFVSPDFMGQGVGKELISYATKLGKTKVDVNEQNYNAKRFYERNGFKVVSRSEFDAAGKPYPILHMSLLY